MEDLIFFFSFFFFYKKNKILPRFDNLALLDARVFKGLDGSRMRTYIISATNDLTLWSVQRGGSSFVLATRDHRFSSDPNQDRDCRTRRRAMAMAMAMATKIK